MMIPQLLQQRLRAAVSNVVAELPEGFVPQAGVATDARFGDYQSNVAMVLAKQQKTNPRALASSVIDAFEVGTEFEKPEIAGPGFLNFRLRKSYLEHLAVEQFNDPRLGIELVAEPRTIVIDFSAPNVAKPMHVGHIRSTIIGDCLSRVTRFLGHRVISDNHIGDWGTQFGMIIYGWKHLLNHNDLSQDPINELVRTYRAVNELSKADATVLERCKEELVKLQSGDLENLAIWRETVDLSLRQLNELYQQLDIQFDHYLGESFYNDKLRPLVAELEESGLAIESEGAMCVFFPDIPELAEKPAIVRKSDGAFNYTTTDLATIDYRCKEWSADAIWYVVGAPQQLHFQQIFATTRKRNRYSVELVHIAHGSILGEDRKLMKTRSGDNVELKALLEEGVERAYAIVHEKNPELEDHEKRAIASIIGIGAIKYAELSQHRMTDYLFSWDKMLAFQGNTAPYIQNAYVRTRAIFRRLGVDVDIQSEVSLDDPAERSLAFKLIQFGEIVSEILTDFRPNLLCNYLYELSQSFHSFYESCHVLQAEGKTRNSRLLLCDLTSKVLRQGLQLLGIRVTERM